MEGPANRVYAGRMGAPVTGVDYAPSAIALARANAARSGLDVTFLVGDCLTLADIADGSVELVVDNHVLHCISVAGDRLALLKSVARVLAPGGLLFSETMSCEGSFNAQTLGIDPVTRISPSGSRIWVSHAELQAELQAAGLAVVYSEQRAPNEPSGATLITYARRM